MNKIFNIYFLRKILLFICVCLGIQSYGQKKNTLFLDAGTGFQYSKTKIPNSTLSSIVNSPIPKLFLGFGVEHKFNKRISLILNLNTNFSKTQSKFNYYNDTDQFSYKSKYYHIDLNYGLALGIKYYPEFGKNRFSIGTGLNFQKIAPQEIFSGFDFLGGINGDTSIMSTSQTTNSNNFQKKYNSLIYYLNAGYSIGKKQKSDFIFELNSTLNKPIWGTDEFYYNTQLVEKSSYKINILFAVIKYRRRF
jgi:hypothetical protein